MKKYMITQTAPALQSWSYEVVANSEEEAIQMIENGDVECCNYEVLPNDNYSFEDGDYEVHDIQDIEE
jgi:hypothetical protein